MFFNYLINKLWNRSFALDINWAKFKKKKNRYKRN